MLLKPPHFTFRPAPELGRIEDVAVIREVEAAGFKLDGRSAVLAHPGDDHTLKVVDTGIRGKTDQFVLRCRKPR